VLDVRPGRRHKVRALCQTHADAVFGTENPPWRRLDAKFQRDIIDEWLLAMTILAHGGNRPMDELMAEIAAVNNISTDTIRLVSPLLPGEAHDLQEAARAQQQLRRRETTVHALVTQILLDWCATATGETRSQVLPAPGAETRHLAQRIRTTLPGTRHRLRLTDSRAVQTTSENESGEVFCHRQFRTPAIPY
jgi:hypothetical protein